LACGGKLMFDTRLIDWPVLANSWLAPGSLKGRIQRYSSSACAGKLMFGAKLIEGLNPTL